MKPLVICLLIMISFSTFSQISFFKQINDVEEGSYPSNFTEFKGEVYFTVETIDGTELWKTDGTNQNTIKFFDKFLARGISGTPTSLFQNKYFLICNEELYFTVLNLQNQYIYELWKTDGINIVKVSDSASTPQLCFNNLPRSETSLAGALKNIILNDKIIWFQTRYNSSLQRNLLDIKKTNFQNQEENIATIDSIGFSSSSSYADGATSFLVNNEVYFFVTKQLNLNFEGNGALSRIELWKTDGNTISYVKKIIDKSINDFNFKIVSLANFNGKLIFLSNSNELWISDGTNTGTNQVGNISNVSTNLNNNTFGFFADKFIFNKATNGDYELWSSNGTENGTFLLKDLSLNSSSYPNNFEKIGDKVFFKTSNNDLWQSDGTESGTIFLMNIPFPQNQIFPIIKDNFIYTSDQKLIFSRYSIEAGYELWKSDGTIADMHLVKNIITSKVNDAIGLKVKMGGSWYFNGKDTNGQELWKTDGTSNGTVLVKDLNPGFFDSYISEMVATEKLIFFTASQNNQSNLFRSDGTENGTFIIPIPKVSQDFYWTANKLTIAGNRVFFTDTGNNIWVTDGSLVGTYKVESSSFFVGSPQQLIACGNNIIIFNGQLFFSNGNVGNTVKLFELNDPERPIFATCFTSFKGKTYFLGATYLQNSTYNNRCLFETDGTKLGTKIIKTFNNDDKFLDSRFLFLEKSQNNLYFRSNYVESGNLMGSFDLWTSDGTSLGTVLLKNISITINSKLSFSNNNNFFFLNVYKQLIPSVGQAYISDGTAVNTFKIKDFNNLGGILKVVKSNQKLYFTQYESNTGLELWETDGTIAGTKLTAEIRPGQANSQIGNLMDFDNKLLLTGTDGINGIALWQYIDNTQIKSIKSGNWDDPTTWSTGQVPNINDIVTIDENHTITIPAAIQANLFTIIIKTGGVLEIGNGSGLNLNKAN